MATMDSGAKHIRETAPPRRPGAPKGNRNAWKHGGRSAAAKAEREAARSALMARLPDGSRFVRIAEDSEPELERFGWHAALAQFRSNKTNNSISRTAEGEGDPPPNFSENKTNNSVARDGRRRRGAPKGNRNALKHGFHSGKRREFDSGLRNFLRRLDMMCELARAMSNANAGKAR
jgi:uncharacterized protein YjcR